MGKMRQFLLASCLLGYLAVASAQITPVSNAAFYPYGPGTADILDPAADDSSSGAQSLSTPFPFFGKSYSALYVNTNGDISFRSAVTGYTTNTFPVSRNRVLAAFFTDIKTSNGDRSGYIYHRETTDAAILARATTDIQTAYPADHGSFAATWAYVATWHQVGIYGAIYGGVNLRNTFQLVLITDGCKSFALFNYDQIQFLQGSGDGTTGTGPNPAQVGINGGDGYAYSLHPYSKTTNLYNLPAWTDPAVPGPPGRWYRRTDLATEGEIPALVCPPSYKRREERCFKFNTRRLDYPDAKADCAADGTQLLNIRSQEDNELLVYGLRRFLSNNGRGRGVWIGLSDEDTEGTFVWEDGTPYDPSGYTNWAPDAAAMNNGDLNCVYMKKTQRWQWYLQECVKPMDRKTYICVTDAVTAESECS